MNANWYFISAHIVACTRTSHKDTEILTYINSTESSFSSRKQYDPHCRNEGYSVVVHKPTWIEPTHTHPIYGKVILSSRQNWLIYYLKLFIHSAIRSQKKRMWKMLIRAPHVFMWWAREPAFNFTFIRMLKKKNGLTWNLHSKWHIPSLHLDIHNSYPFLNARWMASSEFVSLGCRSIWFWWLDVRDDALFVYCVMSVAGHRRPLE